MAQQGPIAQHFSSLTVAASLASIASPSSGTSRRPSSCCSLTIQTPNQTLAVGGAYSLRRAQRQARALGTGGWRAPARRIAEARSVGGPAAGSAPGRLRRGVAGGRRPAARALERLEASAYAGSSTSATCIGTDAGGGLTDWSPQQAINWESNL